MDSIEIENIEGDDVPVLYFRGQRKGMRLNKTNGLAIAKLYGDETDDWIGQRIELYSVPVQNPRGEMVDGIRLRRPPAQRRPPVTNDEPARPRRTLLEDDAVPPRRTRPAPAGRGAQPSRERVRAMDIRSVLGLGKADAPESPARRWPLLCLGNRLPKSIRDGALQLAKLGVATFPIRPNDKRPLCEGWQAQATTDPAVIRGWFKKWPDCNIGMPCGVEPLRLLVLVVDPDKGGEASLDALERELRAETMQDHFVPGPP
jgi:hypothetical protein